MVYPIALVNSKVLHQDTFQSTGTVIAQGDVEVQGDTVLGNAAGDTVGFYGSAGSARQAAITNVAVGSIAGDSSTVNITASINSDLNSVETAVNSILTVLRNLNLIAT